MHGAKRNSLSDGREMSGDNDPGDLAEVSKLLCRRGRPSKPQLTVSTSFEEILLLGNARHMLRVCR